MQLHRDTNINKMLLLFPAQKGAHRLRLCQPGKLKIFKYVTNDQTQAIPDRPKTKGGALRTLQGTQKPSQNHVKLFVSTRFKCICPEVNFYGLLLRIRVKNEYIIHLMVSECCGP
ncbi:unnamed protein product [Parnassius mnemosyne]|uniref:Uncharacterized protein n=1 Tax=Parnassius mnemosyne TaxID=213953 RepID=A0AAV1KIX9_9NEOP